MNRIFAKLKLGESRQTEIKTVVENSLKKGKQPPERTTPQRSPEDRFIEELFKKPQKEKTENDNPSVARTEKSRPSEPTSKMPQRAAEGTARKAEDRPSVREELREIRSAQKQKEAEKAVAKEAIPQDKSAAKTVEHIQPPIKRKPRVKGR